MAEYHSCHLWTTLIARLFLFIGEGRVGTEESAFIRVFASRSWNQLKLISAEYQNLRGRSLEAAIKREFSGWIETTLQDICKSIKSCLNRDKR